MTGKELSKCNHCGYNPSSERDSYLHRMNKHVRAGREEGEGPEPAGASSSTGGAFWGGLTILGIAGTLVVIVVLSLVRSCASAVDSFLSPRPPTVTFETRDPDLEQDRRTQIAAAFTAEWRRTPAAQREAWCNARNDEQTLERLLLSGAREAEPWGDATRQEMTAVVRALLDREC